MQVNQKSIQSDVTLCIHDKCEKCFFSPEFAMSKLKENSVDCQERPLYVPES